MHIDPDLQYLNNSYLNIYSNFQSSIQIGIASWIILLFHCMHFFYFKNVILPININSNLWMYYYAVKLLNLGIPLYLFSHGWKLENKNIENFSRYFNYHIKFLLPGATYGLLIFIIGYFDGIESNPYDFDFGSLVSNNWIWTLPYKFGMLIFYLYHFLLSMIMYPVFSLIKKNEQDCDYIRSDEYNYISNPEFFDGLGDELSNEVKIGNPYFKKFENIKNKFSGNSSKLPYIISNIFIYFFIINIFYYFSFEYKLYLVYTFFYLSIFVIYSLRYVQKYVNINGICVFMNIIYISLITFTCSQLPNSSTSDGTMLFTTLFLFLTYYFTGYAMYIPDLQFNLQKYYLDFLLFIPVIYSIFNFPDDMLRFSPIFFPIAVKNEEIGIKIISTWIGIIFTLSILYRCFMNQSLNEKIINIFNTLPYILIVLFTFIFLIYERTTQLNMKFH